MQQMPFAGIADPTGGRLRVVAGPQASLATIPEDGNGNRATAAPGTAQVYGPSVTFASGGVGYPATCNPGSPLVMSTSVEILSGFTEQLRNVYTRITSVSGGQTFCGTRASPGTFGAQLDPSLGLFLYQPLDGGSNPASAIRRTLPWAMNLPDNGAFWFRGELWAEVIPQPPTFVAGRPDGYVFHTGADPSIGVAYTWRPDANANGANPEGFVVGRPTDGGAQLTIFRCGPAAAAYDPATCTTPIYGPTVVTSRAYQAVLAAGSWYQWSLRAAFTLPGDTAKSIGTLVRTRYVKVAQP